MKVKTTLILLLLGFGFFLSEPLHSADSTVPNFLSATDFDIEKILTPPPGKFSPQTADEIKQIIAFQKNLSPNQIATIKSEDSLTPTVFLTGLFPNWSDLNKAAASTLLNLVTPDTVTIVEKSKEIWDRPHPSHLDPSIIKFVDIPSGSSYPGMKATMVYTWAQILIAVAPDKKDEIIARADEIAQNRVLAGVQFPSDIAAGKILGNEIGKKILAAPQFQPYLQTAIASLQAVSLPISSPAAPSFGVPPPAQGN